MSISQKAIKAAEKSRLQDAKPKADEVRSKRVIPTSGLYIPHQRVQLICDDPSLAKQSSADECDINLIMKRYQSTGVIDHINNRQPTYGDYINVPDYHEAMTQIRLATESFEALPAQIRADFDNDPAKFLDFAQDPANGAQMVEYGLATVVSNPNADELIVEPTKPIPDPTQMDLEEAITSASDS